MSKLDNLSGHVAGACEIPKKNPEKFDPYKAPLPEPRIVPREEKQNPLSFRAVTPRPPSAATETALPPCPLCLASARAFPRANEKRIFEDTGVWSQGTLEHLCDCDLTNQDAYTVAVNALRAEQVTRYRFKESLPSEYRDAINIPYDSDTDWQAVRAADGFSGPGILYLYGASGNGKDFLASKTSWRLLDHRPAFYALASDFIESQRNAPSPDLRKYGLIFLEDLGKEGMTAWTRDRLFGLVHGLWSERARQTIIITSQLDPAELGERFSPGNQDDADAIMGRLAHGSRVVRVQGPNRRLRTHRR